MSSQVLEIGVPSSTESDERARFLANMSEGLHALAQPLTILRTSVMASAAPGVDTLKQRRYLDLSSQQIERACDLFEILQDLVIASQIEADREPIELADLLSAVAKSQRAVLEASDVELRVVMPSGLPAVLGDVTRTFQAISAALKFAATVAVVGDVVEVFVSTSSRYVELIIRTDRVHGRPMNSSERLSLTLAESNILSQRGEYEYAEDPFCMRMTLPIQFSEP